MSHDSELNSSEVRSKLLGILHKTSMQSIITLWGEFLLKIIRHGLFYENFRWPNADLLSEPCIFLLIAGQSDHPAWSVKIALHSVKSQGFFLLWWVATLMVLYCVHSTVPFRPLPLGRVWRRSF